MATKKTAPVRKPAKAVKTATVKVAATPAVPAAPVGKKPPQQILFSIGDVVQQALKPLQGTVQDVQLRDGVPHYTVAYTDPETGDSDVREFTGEQIEDIPEGK